MNSQDCEQIRKIAIRTNKKIKELMKDNDTENPVDADILKTTKAMFYEEVIHILKKK